MILNWGNSHTPPWMTNDAVARVLNRPTFVGNASNKLNTLRQLQGAELPVVPFTTDREEAREWDVIYVRNKLTGHSGEGIEVINTTRPNGRELSQIAERLRSLGHTTEAESLSRNTRQDVTIPEAPLYTKGIENHGEYRVHVFNGEVIDYRKKCRHDGDDATDVQSQVRTHGNGWIYRKDGLRRLDRVMELATNAISTLGLNFGAVDIIMDQEGTVFVLEVNTALGLEGSTLTNYVTAIKRHFNVV